MKLVLKYSNKIKLYTDQLQFDKITAFVLKQFSLTKDSISLTYFDDQGDDITVLCNQDLQIMEAVFQGSEYVKVNVTGVQVQSQISEPPKISQPQPIIAQEPVVNLNVMLPLESQLIHQQINDKLCSDSKDVTSQNVSQNIAEKKETIVEKPVQVEKENEGKENRHCQRQKFNKMNCFMNNMVAKLVDQRIKLLLPCLKQQLLGAKQQKPQKNTDLVHEGTQCKGCLMSPIVGIRYECTKCPNFSLCEKCQQKIQHDHNLLKVKKVENKKQNNENQERCFEKFFKHGGPWSHHGPWGHHGGHHGDGHFFMKKIMGLSYIFGGQPDQYRSFAMENRDLKPRQLFQKYAKMVNMPKEQFNTKFIQLRCIKLSRFFGKPAENYKEFVMQNFKLGQKELMELLYEKGLEKREDNLECWKGRRYNFNESFHGRNEEKRQKCPFTRQKIFCFNEKKQEEKKPVSQKKEQKIEKSEVIITESLLQQPKPLDKPEVARAKGALYLKMTEIFEGIDKKQLYKFIDQNYSEGKEDELINIWIEKICRK